MSAKKHIVFDWNGTLFDDIHVVHGCTNRILESEGHKPVTLPTFQASYDMPFRRFYEGIGLEKEQVDRMMALENSAFHDHYEPLAERTGLRDGALTVLGHAHQNGIANVILSNHIVGAIQAQLKRLGIEHLFEEVLAYPDRATQFQDMNKSQRLAHFIKKHAANPAGMLIVGDSVEEIEAGRAHKVASVAITGGCVSEARLSAAKPDYIIHSLHELKPIMQERGFA